MIDTVSIRLDELVAEDSSREKRDVAIKFWKIFRNLYLTSASGPIDARAEARACA